MADPQLETGTPTTHPDWLGESWEFDPTGYEIKFVHNHEAFIERQEDNHTVILYGLVRSSLYQELLVENEILKTKLERRWWKFW